MAIITRKAQSADGDFIATLMLQSSREGKKVGIFDAIFDTSDDSELIQKMTRLTQSEYKSAYHHSNFLIAVEDGADVGILCNYEARIANTDTLTKALAHIGVDESYLERLTPYLLCLPTFDRQTWVLDFMKVIDEAHEYTILKELISKSLLSARLKGYAKAQTIIEIGDGERKLAYEKLGFRYVDEKHSDDYLVAFGRSGIMRMEITL